MGPTRQPHVVHTVTSATSSRSANHESRVRRYLVMMGIRIACFGLIFVTTGWLRWAAIIGAVALPYFAVVIANAVRPQTVGRIQPVTPQDDPTRRLER